MQSIMSRILGLTLIAAVSVIAFSSPVWAQYENRGDINLNGIPFELEDAALFADYFMVGMSVFTIDPEAQIAATDVNMDGYVLTIADMVYMVRVIWGEGDPPTPPADTISLSLNQYEFESSLRLGVNLGADQGDRMFLQYNTEGTSSIDVVVYPGYDEISVQYEFTGNNLMLLVSGLHSIQASTPRIKFMKIDYTGEAPVLETIGGTGFNGEALKFSVRSDWFQRSDINMNMVAWEIGDAVMLINALIYGEELLIYDLEVQLAASDANLDGIPLTVEDMEFLIAVITGRIDPDDPLGPTFQEHLIVSQSDESIHITSTAEDEVGAIHLDYLAPNLTDYQVTLSEDLAAMDVSYEMIEDTLRILIFNVGNEFIAGSATDVATISFTGEQPSLLSASSAGFEAEKVNLSIIERGDVNGDGAVNVGDVVTIIGIVFIWDLPEEWQLVAMDLNCDGVLNIGEAVYLINYIFKAGPPPMCE